jgi:hypothetical protein
MASNHGADYYLLKGNNVCNSFKMGEFNGLRCCKQRGHEGEHLYCIVKKVRQTTEAMRTQQKLFRELGTLHRTRANLKTTMDHCENSYQIQALQVAIKVVERLIQVSATKMKNIPKAQPKSNSTV